MVNWLCSFKLFYLVGHWLKNIEAKILTFIKTASGQNIDLYIQFNILFKKIRMPEKCRKKINNNNFDNLLSPRRIDGGKNFQ